MKRYNFTDPYPSLPPLERAIIRLRSFESTLAIYYAEELRYQVVDQIWHARSFMAQGKPFGRRQSGVEAPSMKDAVTQMISDNAITTAEAELIRSAVDFRNDIAHRTDHLFSDLEQRRFTASDFDMEPESMDRFRKFDHAVIEKFDECFSILSRTSRSHYRNIMTFHRRGYLLFSSTEKSLKAEIKREKKNIERLTIQRRRKIDQLNIELASLRKFFARYQNDLLNLRHPGGRMTPRGGEICFRLFDENFDFLIICQVFEMKLPSILRRYKIWRSLGGKSRQKVLLSSLPIVRVRSRFDD